MERLSRSCQDLAKRSMHHVFPCVLVSLPCVSMFFQDLGKATKIRVTGQSLHLILLATQSTRSQVPQILSTTIGRIAIFNLSTVNGKAQTSIQYLNSSTIHYQILHPPTIPLITILNLTHIASYAFVSEPIKLFGSLDDKYIPEE